VSLGDAKQRQMSGSAELPSKDRGEAPKVRRSGEASTAASGNERSGTDRLMEEVVEGRNAKAALQRVKQNKGSPGVDGMTEQALPKYLAEHWIEIREQLLAGTYQPTPVSDLGAERTTRCARRSSTSRKGAVGWWTWISRSSSTA
jgi:RNA-directed DNA polymerase